MCARISGEKKQFQENVHGINQCGSFMIKHENIDTDLTYSGGMQVH